MTDSKALAPLVATGIVGFDDILRGGFTAKRLYLIEGNPGSGKTTLALQFLMEGARLGERGLYVTLSETAEELRAVAASHGWSLERIDVFDMSPSEDSLEPDSNYTMFHPSEIELSETTKAVLAEVNRIKPTRVVFDSLSEMRLLAQNPLRYRRQILALKHFFAGQQATVLLLDDRTAEVTDLQLHSLAHGVISLEQLSPEYGPERRRLRVVKMRGRQYRGGYHDYRIIVGGLEVYPRLVASEHHHAFPRGQITSGVQGLDHMLGGGIDRGTNALLIGPAGVGKSSVAALYAFTAAQRGEHSVIFLFDEALETMITRTTRLGFDLRPYIESGVIHIRQVDAADLSPGEFVHVVRQAVETNDSRMVIIDSLNGYLNAMPEERFLLIHLHELFMYLSQRGVTALLLVAQHGVIGRDISAPIDVTYLADAVILLRYFESEGQVRQAISVVKQRSGAHERAIRQIEMSPQGIQIGPALREFHGIFNGTPTYTGVASAIIDLPHDESANAAE